MSRLLRWLGGRFPSVPEFRARDGLITLGVFLAAAVLFVAVSLPIELLLGGKLAAPHLPSAGTSSTDAIWHLATALVLVLPVRRRVAVWLGPLLALGLDIDHVFGAYLPTVVNRPAHDLLFVIVVALILYAVRGRAAAWFGAGAVVAHVAVDGGSFPFLAPLTPAAYPLPFAGQALLVVVAALLFFVAFDPLRALRSWRRWFPLACACGVVIGAVYVVLPFIPGVYSI